MNEEQARRLGKTYSSQENQVRINCPHCEYKMAMYYRKSEDEWVCPNCKLVAFINVKDWGKIP